MTRSEKNELIEQLSEEFSSSAAVIVCNYKSMSVSDIESVRNTLRSADLKAKVVKNKLCMLALDKAEKPGLTLSEMNFVIWGEDLVNTAKTVMNLEKENEKLEIKAAHIEGEAVDRSKVEAYSKLPGKEELLGMLLSTWTAPARNFVYVLSGVQREFITVLDAVKKQKESA